MELLAARSQAFCSRQLNLSNAKCRSLRRPRPSASRNHSPSYGQSFVTMVSSASGTVTWEHSYAKPADRRRGLAQRKQYPHFFNTGMSVANFRPVLIFKHHYHYGNKCWPAPAEVLLTPWHASQPTLLNHACKPRTCQRPLTAAKSAGPAVAAEADRRFGPARSRSGGNKASKDCTGAVASPSRNPPPVRHLYLLSTML